MYKMMTLQVTLFVLIAVGFFLKKKGIFKETGQKNLTDLVIYVVLPCNIVNAFMVDFSLERLYACAGILLISLGIQIFAVIYGKHVAARGEAEGRAKCIRYGIICSNAGFLGNPIAEGLYGSEGLLLASFYLLPQRIMMWSEGIAVFSGESDMKSTVKKVVTHPCVVACFVGLGLMLSQAKLPVVVTDPIQALGRCNTALSMLVIGMILADINVKQFLDVSLIRFAVHRLLIIPGLVLLACRFLPVSDMVRSLSVLLAAMPAGATTSILASKYDQDPKFATELVVSSTLLSLPSVALWSFLVL
jgi:predicted permease